MKKSFKLFAASAIVVAAVSCAKELAPESALNTDTGRMISAVFENNGEKTTLDGKTPKWAANDKIWLTDGSAEQTVTLTSDMISGNAASFSTTLTGETVYAVYPAASAVEVKGGKINIEIPTEQNGKFATANICAAVTTGSTLNFRNLTSILRFDGHNEHIGTIGLKAAGIAGTFSVDLSGTKPVLTAVEAADSIAVDAKTTTYIAVAPVTLPAETVFSFMGETTAIGSRTTNNVNKLAVNTIYPMGYAAIEGEIDAPFSVGDGVVVHFAHGNLLYCPTEERFYLAPRQYDYVGGTADGKNGNCPSANLLIHNGVVCKQNPYKGYAGFIDLFGWGTSGYDNTAEDPAAKFFSPISTSKDTGIGANNDYGYGPSVSGGEFSLTGEYEEYDWGVHNAIIGGGNEAGLWRTLTKDEFTFLTGSTAPRSTNKRKMVNVNVKDLDGASVKVAGLLVMPDTYTGNLHETYVDGEVSLEQWEALDAQGALFLPACGYRDGWWCGNMSCAPNLSSSNQAYIYYWTVSGVDISNARTFRWKFAVANPGWGDNLDNSITTRKICLAVRLVTE